MSSHHEYGPRVPPVQAVRVQRDTAHRAAIAGPGLMALALLTLLAHAVASVIVAASIVLALFSVMLWVVAFSVSVAGVIATPVLIRKLHMPLPLGFAITAVFLCSGSMMTIAFIHNVIRTWAL